MQNMVKLNYHQRRTSLPLLFYLSILPCVTALITSSTARQIQLKLLSTKGNALVPSKSSTLQQHASKINHFHRYPQSSHLLQNENPEDLKSAAPNTLQSITDSLTPLLEKIRSTASNIDIPAAIENTLSNDPPFGSRGEIYVLLQAVLVLSVLYGSFPFVNNLLTFLFGPFLFFLGGFTILLGVGELGPNLSPWPVPSTKSETQPKGDGLVRNGIVFSEVRHPIYTGLLCLCAGLGVWTGSATRLLLTFGLYLVLDAKADFEEEALVEKFGVDYLKYRKEVTGKFMPERLVRVFEGLKKRS